MRSENGHRLDATVREAAVKWHVLLSGGGASDADYENFADWIAEDPAHADAYERVETFSGKLEDLKIGADLDHLIDIGVDPVESKQANDNWFSGRTAIAASVAGVFFVAAIFGLQQFSAKPEYLAIAAQPDAFLTQELSDGTRITLAPSASFEATISKDARHVASLAGVSYFDVASDFARPFTVDLGDQVITVVGTQFEIVAFAGRRSVAVSEGVVRVRQKNNGAEDDVRLGAGERLTFTSATPHGERMTTPPESIGAWRSGFFEFESANAQTIAAQLNRFYGGELFVIDASNPPQLSFSGVLALSDPAGTAQRLSELAPVALSEIETGYVLSAPSRKEN